MLCVRSIFLRQVIQVDIEGDPPKKKGPPLARLKEDYRVRMARVNATLYIGLHKVKGNNSHESLVLLIIGFKYRDII